MSFLKKMAKFQDSRISWAILVFVSVALVVIAHSLFQNYAYMPPCEQCVYIRFAFLCMALGGVIAMINPKNCYLPSSATSLPFGERYRA